MVLVEFRELAATKNLEILRYSDTPRLSQHGAEPHEHENKIDRIRTAGALDQCIARQVCRSE